MMKKGGLLAYSGGFFVSGHQYIYCYTVNETPRSRKR